MKNTLIVLLGLVLGSSIQTAFAAAPSEKTCTYVEYETGEAWEQTYTYENCFGKQGVRVRDRVFGGKGLSGNWGQKGTRKFWVVRDSVVAIRWPANSNKKADITADKPAVKISCGGINYHDLYCDETKYEKIPDGVKFTVPLQELNATVPRQ